MEGRIMGHVTSPEKMQRGAIAAYWIITAWIGILSSGAFPLPSHPQACRARQRPLRRAGARARQPACTSATPEPGARAGRPARRGCERAGSTPALPCSRPYSVCARWWATGASRSRDD